MVLVIKALRKKNGKCNPKSVFLSYIIGSQRITMILSIHLFHKVAITGSFIAIYTLAWEIIK
jgi:hypothetical protein